MPCKTVLEKSSIIKKIRSRISSAGIDAVLVNDQRDIEYVTGFCSTGSVLVVPRRGDPAYFVNKMDAMLAGRFIKNRMVRIETVSGPVSSALAEYAEHEKIRKLGIDRNSLSVLFYDNMRKVMPKVKMLPEVKSLRVNSVIKSLREIKTERELRVLRKAARKTCTVWRRVARDIKHGVDEKKIASIIDVYIYGMGYENSFPTIAAAGKNTADPHAIPTAKKLRSGEHMMVDFGMRVEGYCSDLTRTWYKGRINRQIRDFHNHVRKAQDIAIKGVKPGIKIGTIAGKIEDYFNNSNLKEYVVHGLGHGIGLDIHEDPFLRRGNTARFRKGMVVTVEPGLYRPGLGGVRREDMVVVTKTGCEVLTV